MRERDDTTRQAPTKHETRSARQCQGQQSRERKGERKKRIWQEINK